jgi:predicted metal-dependent HD superfamily phosphohydrolase
VRQEYAHVPDEPFAAGRAGVLGRLLAMPRLYRTPIARDLWERRARENVAAELSDLSAP